MSYGDDPSAALRMGSEQLTYLLFLYLRMQCRQEDGG
jgi:hypothetical protein